MLLRYEKNCKQFKSQYNLKANLKVKQYLTKKLK